MGQNSFYDGVEKGTVTAGEKQIVTMINKIIIFPDKKYYDVSAGILKNLESSYQATGMSFATNTITKSGANFNTLFSAGDAVSISGCTTKPENNKDGAYIIIKSVTGTTLTFDDNTFTATSSEAGNVTISRSIPNLEYICTSNNRLWGVADNTIYGSKLGDPTNFYYYKGLNNDSYAVQVETDGEFTGCANFSTHIAFFKEDCIHKLYGSKPSQYQVQTSFCHGIEKGSSASLVAINDILYYKSRAGIMAYMGSQPEILTYNFGDDYFINAKAGTDGTKYYVSMHNESKNRQEFLVYDITRQMWHKEDDTNAVDFCYSGGKLYYIDSNNKLMCVNDRTATEKIEWSATLGNFSEYSENNKIYSKISGRIDVDVATEVYIDLKRDNFDWENVYSNRVSEKGVLTISFQPVRCNNFSIRIRGKGYAIIHSLVREYLIGSDNNVD